MFYKENELLRREAKTRAYDSMLYRSSTYTDGLFAINRQYYDVLDKFPELPPNIHWGELRNVATGSCLDTMGHASPSLMATSHCHGFGNNQLTRFNAKGQSDISERCVEADGQDIKYAFCHLGTADGPWQYDKKIKTVT